MSENAEKVKSEKMVKMEELRKQLADLENEGPAPRADSSKPNKHLKEGVETLVSTDEEESDEEIEVKPKRERTEKQKQAFMKAQETRLKKAVERKKEKALKDQEEKEELEKKLIDKAIKVKKKQIKKMQVIEQLSDDDTPIEKLKPILKKQDIKLPEKPKLKFV